MTIRTGALVGGVIIAGALAGVVTSQQPAPSPVAAIQVDLKRSRADNADLADARKDPLAIRTRGVLGREPAAVRFLALADASSVPVLAPPEPPLLRTARIFTGDRHYMLTLQRGAQIIEIYGSTKAFRSPIAPPAASTGTTPNPPNVPTETSLSDPRVQAPRTHERTARAVAQAQAQAQASGLANVRAYATESGVDVTFSRFGVAYQVSFICEGTEVPGCTETEAVVFASRLRLVGGGAS